MATQVELVAFVKEALGRGHSRSEIQAVLEQAGWRGADIRAALDSFAEIAFPLPIPRPKPALDARDAFVYLVLFSALYASAFNLIALLFQVIEHYVPDAVTRAGGMGFSERIRWPLATLIVSFPAFLLVSRRVDAEVQREPAKRESKVRRWLTYLTLFVATASLGGDLIALVSGFLGGDLTSQFLLKVLVVGAVAGSVFAFYRADLRAKPSDTPR